MLRTGRVAIVVLSCFAWAPASAAPPGARPAANPQLTLQVVDSSGAYIPARARIRDAYLGLQPPGPNATHMTHSGNIGYFYINAPVTVTVPPGPTRVSVTRGFDMLPIDTAFVCTQDMTVRVTVRQFADPHALRWYSGDMHVHSRHPPLEYPITPELTERVLRAEGLDVTHMLDQTYRFTGIPEVLGDGSLLYYTFEHRNQTYGHVSLPGLQDSILDVTTLAPAPAYPMLWDLRKQLEGGADELMILSHSHTTSDFYMQSNWPGAGLGRELAVLAPFGLLDGLDVLSYSNVPEFNFGEWYDLLSAGIALPMTAGTDAVINKYDTEPAGGFRVYAQLETGQPFTYANWLAAVRSGRTFVTSFPLVEEFSINGNAMGAAIEWAGAQLTATIHMRAACAVGLSRLAIVADSAEIWSRSFGSGPATVRFDTTIVLTRATPAWMALRVEGVYGHPLSHPQGVVAHTNAIRFLDQGVPRQAGRAAERLLLRVVELGRLVEERGNWAAAWQRDTVLARLGRARDWYLERATLPVAAPTTPDLPVLRASPNPSRLQVRLDGFHSPVAIYDLRGRRVAGPGAGVEPDGRGWVWSGRDRGRPAAPGIYFARGTDGTQRLRLVRLR